MRSRVWGDRGVKKKSEPIYLSHFKIAFQNVFHGPLQLFGKLLYRQMVVHGSGNTGKDGQIKDRITSEQFIKAGKELLRMFDEAAQHKYYFQLFAAGKDHITKEGKFFM